MSEKHFCTPTQISAHIICLQPFLVQPQILGSSMFWRWAGGPWGRDPFNTSDLWSRTLFLCLSGILLYFLLLSQNWKPTSSLLHTDLSCCFFLLIFSPFFLFSSHSTNTSPVVHVFGSVCVCACVRACMCVPVQAGILACMRACVDVCVWWYACIHRPL